MSSSDEIDMSSGNHRSSGSWSSRRELPPSYALPPLPPHAYSRDERSLNTSIYDNHYLDNRLQDSFTSSEETATTKSTVRTVNFREPPPPISEPEVGSSQHMTSSIQVEQMLTDEVIVHHPRSLLILAGIQFSVAIQILVFAIICIFYGGCPFVTAVWTSVLFIINSVLGFLFLKVKPRRYMLYAYIVGSFVCVFLTLVLFGVTASLLDREDTTLQQKGWSPMEEHLFQWNRIVENTKIAMYSLHLILSPLHGICAAVSAFLLISNLIEAKEGKVRRGYYVSNAPVGHQTVLVPIELKQVKEIPPHLIQEPGAKKSVAIQTAGGSIY